MKLIPLTKQEARLAEAETTPISNIAFNPLTNQTKDQKELQAAISKMFDWKYTKSHQFRKGLGTTLQNKTHMTKHLGKPLYHANYEYREAVWGFKVNSIRVICYYSTKGFSVQVDKNCDPKEAANILRSICKKLEQ